ncbi:MAG: outer membrane channel protein [Syntrophus sp. PtaB.Bin001]|nr:MAG: outer membrane channel protein [Syntrophus sp. PtaB.Bin001]
MPSFFRWLFIPLLLMALASAYAATEELNLDSLIAEALKNNPEIHAAEARIDAADLRVRQARALPDPMLMVGYQNEGTSRYTYGDSPDAQWIFSASQTFPFFGKRGLKGEMAAADADGMRAAIEGIRLKTVGRVKELYYDLFLSYRNIDLINEKTFLYSKIEEAAIDRYTSGISGQQDVLMAQTEKYMLREKREMLLQKIRSLEAMLNLTLGRENYASLGRPAELTDRAFDSTTEELIAEAYESSPDIQIRKKNVAAAEARIKMAKREYYPDFTVAAQTNQRGGEMSSTSMYMLTTTFNIPLYFKWKQEPAVREATAMLQEAKYDMEGTKLMTAAVIRDNAAMVAAADRLISLYRKALIPKASQDFESTLAGYATGKNDALTVISRLRAFLDVEILYWTQVVEKQKAIARIDAVVGKKEQLR